MSWQIKGHGTFLFKSPSSNICLSNHFQASYIYLWKAYDFFIAFFKPEVWQQSPLKSPRKQPIFLLWYMHTLFPPNANASPAAYRSTPPEPSAASRFVAEAKNFGERLLSLPMRLPCCAPPAPSCLAFGNLKLLLFPEAVHMVTLLLLAVSDFNTCWPRVLGSPCFFQLFPVWNSDLFPLLLHPEVLAGRKWITTNYFISSQHIPDSLVILICKHSDTHSYESSECYVSV